MPTNTFSQTIITIPAGIDVMYVCIKCRKVFKRNPARINKFNMPDLFYSDGIWERATYVSKLCRKCKNKDFPMRMAEFETIPYDPSVPTIRMQLAPWATDNMR